MNASRSSFSSALVLALLLASCSKRVSQSGGRDITPQREAPAPQSSAAPSQSLLEPLDMGPSQPLLPPPLEEIDPVKEPETFARVLKAEVKKQFQKERFQPSDLPHKGARALALGLAKAADLWGETFASYSQVFSLGAEDIGFNTGVVGNLILEIEQSTERNRAENAAPEEAFIAKNRLKVGYRAGYSFGLGADATYEEEYILVRALPAPPPRSTQSEILKEQQLSLKLAHMAFNPHLLPPRHTLMIQKGIYPRVRFKVEDLFPIFLPVGGQIYKAYLQLEKTIIQERPNSDLLVYHDDQTHLEYGGKTYLNIKYANFPFARFKDKTQGNLQAELRVIPAAALRQKPEIRNILGEAMALGNFSAIMKFGRLFSIDSRYKEFSNRFNLFDMLYWGTNTRTDTITVTTKRPNGDDDDPPGEEEVQLSSDQHRNDEFSGWSLFGHSEDRYDRVVFLDQVHPDDTADDWSAPSMRFSFDLEDSHADIKEVGMGYVRFLDLLAPGKRVSYRPRSHRHKKDPSAHMIADLYYSSEAMEKILKMPDQVYWDQVARSNRMSPALMTYYRKTRFLDQEAAAHLKRITRRVPLSAESKRRIPEGLFKTVDRVYQFLEKLGEARAALSEGQTKKATEDLVAAVQLLSFSRGPYKDATLFAALNHLVGKENFFLHGKVGLDNLPPATVTDGEYYPSDRHFYITLEPLRANDLYHMFDWVKVL